MFGKFLKLWNIGTLAVLADRFTGLFLGWFAYLFSFVYSPKSLIMVREGARPLAGAKKVCVFVHFDRRGRLHDYVYHYLEQLAGIGFTLVFVSNAPQLGEADLERLSGFCARIVLRRNFGYDFGAYREGIAQIPDVTALDQLLLANDSVYGPLHHLSSVLQPMTAAKADVWSASDSWEFHYHLQSYFLLFHNKALRTPAFREFWSRLRLVQSKTWIIRNYEVGLTRAMQGAGLRCRAAYPYRDIAKAIMELVVERKILDGDALDPIRKNYVLMLFNYVNNGIPLNSTHFFWDFLIGNMDFPFIKRELLQKNPANVPLLSYWERLVADRTDYDTDLILRHLEVALKNRSV